MLLIILIKLETHLTLRIINLKLLNMSRTLTNVTFSLNDTPLNGIENCLKLTKFQKQPQTYKIDDINGEIKEGE